MGRIVIAEELFWQPGVDFAAAMRLRGHDTVRLIPGSRDDRHQRRWWSCASQTVPSATTSTGELTAIGAGVMDGRGVDDTQVTEPVLESMASRGHDHAVGRQHSRELGASQIIDKWTMTQYLQSVGIATPPTWADADDIPVTEKGPFLLKPRAGAGGAGIRLLPDVASVRSSAPPGQAEVIQKFMSGTPLDSAGVARDGRVVQLITYTNLVDRKSPFSAAFGITTTHDPRLADYTAQVVQALGITGPFALDAVPGPDGQPLIVDLNLRIWGCWTACQDLGMDVLSAYEYAFGMGDDPGPFQTPPGRFAPILRRPPLQVRTPAQRARWLKAEFGHIRRRQPWLGTDWARATRYESMAWACVPRALRPPAG